MVDGSKNAKAAVPEVVITLNGRQSAGSSLFDTGAFVSVLSSQQAGHLGLTYTQGTEGSRSPNDRSVAPVIPAALRYAAPPPRSRDSPAAGSVATR